MKKKVLVFLLSVCVLLTACKKNNAKNIDISDKVSSKSEYTNKENKKKIIYTSFYPIYNLTEQIGKDKFEIKSFTSLEEESHDWEPSAKDVASLSKSSLLIINGAGMEEWQEDISKSIDIDILDTSKNLNLIDIKDEDGQENEDNHHSHSHMDSIYDPHTWLSPLMAKKQAKKIADKLSEIDPDNKNFYEKNYNTLAKDLDQMIEEYQKKFDKVSDKRFVVSHEAFGYLARDFKLKQISITSISSTADPNAKVMREAIDMLRKEKISTIFYEKNGSYKIARQIADEVDAKAKGLYTLEFVAKEQLKEKVNYQDLMRENLEAIYASLK